MWQRWTGGVLLVVSCMAGKVDQQRLADGTWQITCRLPMDACVREIEKTCLDKRYHIIGGSSEIKLRDAHPSETEYPTSRVGFVCSDYSDPSDAGNPSSRTCGPGDTRVCVGPAACAGGQACRPDGMGFGPCECSPAVGAGDAGAPPAAGKPMGASPASGSGTSMDAGASDGSSRR